MNILDVLIPLAIVAAGIGVALGLGRLLLGDGRPRIAIRESLLGDPQRKWFQALDEATEHHYHIALNVPVDGVLRVDRPQRKWKKSIGGTQLDFVLCDRESLAPALAIRVTEKREQNEDDDVQRAFDSAELPLYRFTAAQLDDPDYLREELE